MSVDGDIIAPTQVPTAVWREAVDGLAVPVFLLRPDCAIVDSNRFGESFLRAGHVLLRLKGRLSVHRQKDDATLASSVLQAHQSGEPAMLRLRIRAGEIGCLVRIAPVRESGLVVLSVAELRLALEQPAGWSRTLLGFSATGSELAEALANGQTLAEFAETHAMPIGTVRTRLKKLLTQSGTNSQAELVSLLLRATILQLVG